MSTTTPSFGWPVPTSGDLVKNGATAIEALGDAIDSSMTDLKGGTTGQVLSKTSNTDMDFTWVAADDTNAIQNTIVDAKGDLIAASAADTPARLAVGNNGETLVADSSTSTGLRYQTGVNLNGIINGAMDIWQRGTSFISDGNYFYTADRWSAFRAALGLTVTRQTASLEGFQYSLRAQRDSGNTSTAVNYISYQAETNDSVKYANKPVTISFWAKAGANYSGASSALAFQLQTGTGTNQKILDGYTGASAIVNATATLTTSWQRFQYTGTAASTANEIGLFFAHTPVGTAGANDWFEVTGIQLEFGSIATNFKRAGGGTIQEELSVCQRYYWRNTAGTSGVSPSYYAFAQGFIPTTGNRARLYFTFPNTMRVGPSTLEYGGTLSIYDGGSDYGISSVVFDSSNPSSAVLLAVTTSDITDYRPCQINALNDSVAYIAFSAEL